MPIYSKLYSASIACASASFELFNIENSLVELHIDSLSRQDTCQAIESKDKLVKIEVQSGRPTLGGGKQDIKEEKKSKKTKLLPQHF